MNFLLILILCPIAMVLITVASVTFGVIFETAKGIRRIERYKEIKQARKQNRINYKNSLNTESKEYYSRYMPN